MFVAHGRHLRAWSPRTVETYERALKAFGHTPIHQAGLAAWKSMDEIEHQIDSTSH